MDKLWMLKLISVMPINPVQLYFIDEAEARKFHGEYASLLTQKPDDECKIFVCEDMLGVHAFRPGWFPYCSLCEVAQVETIWKEIDDHIKEVKAKIGKSSQLGFASSG